jgi:glycosyltransferase involved in cell wall biosynthesis
MFTSGFATVKSLLSSAPLVLISHGYSVQRGPFFGATQRTYISSVGRAIAHKAKCVIAMTSREATRLLSLGVQPERCVIIPPGVDSTLFHPNRGSRDAKRIVWTGRFVPEKNLTCLLEAMALLKRRIPDVELVLAGEGPERAKLAELSRTLHLDAKFPGILARDGIIELLQNATVYALPSTTEAFPIALLEAMACGVPSVVSTGLGLEQIVHGAALIADYRLPQEWALQLETLLTNDDLRRDMSRRARELVAQYDWNIVAEKLERLFVSVVNSDTSMPRG